jgi:acyl-CoA thioesterase FadM
MNLFLRIVLVWLKAKLKPPRQVLDEIVTAFSVWPTDQDMFRHMTNSRYFSLTDVCIIDFMLQTRVWKALSRRGWLPIVVYEDMAFRRMLRWPQRFVVRTRLVGWDEARVILTHAFVRADGETTAEGITIARFVGRNGERIETARVVEALGITAAPPAPPPAAAAALARAKEGYGFAHSRA